MTGIRVQGTINELGWLPDCRSLYARGTRGLYGFTIKHRDALSHESPTME
jgi:hypothetical protein